MVFQLLLVLLRFLARDVLYMRLCYDASVSLSVCDGSALAHYS